MLQEQHSLAGLLPGDVDWEDVDADPLPGLDFLFLPADEVHWNGAAPDGNSEHAAGACAPHASAAGAHDGQPAEHAQGGLGAGGTTEAIRSKNRIAQAKYRSKLKKQRDEMEDTIEECRARLQQQKDCYSRLQNDSQALTARCAAAVTQLLQLARQVPSEASVSTPAPAPVSTPASQPPTPHPPPCSSSPRPPRTKRARLEWPGPGSSSTRDPEPKQHPHISTFRFHAALTLDTILGSVSNPTSALVRYSTRRRGALPDSLTETVAACRQNVAAREGVPVDSTCWFMQLPYEVGNGLHLSFSTHAGSFECMTSTYLAVIFCFLELELLRVAGLANIGALTDALGDVDVIHEADKDTMREALQALMRKHNFWSDRPGHLFPRSQPSRVPGSAGQGPPMTCKSDISCTVGVNKTMKVQEVAKVIIQGMVARYAAVVPDRLTAGGALKSVLLAHRRKCSSLGFVEGSGLVLIPEIVLDEVEKCFLQQHLACWPAGDRKWEQAEQELEGWVDRLRLHLLMVFHFMTTESLRTMHPGHAIIKVAGSVSESEVTRQSLVAFEDIRLTKEQAHSMNSLWQVWQRSRVVFNTQMQSVLQSLASVPLVLDLPLTLLNKLHNGAFAGAVGLGAWAMDMGAAGLCAGHDNVPCERGLVGKFVGPSVACTLQAQQQMTRLSKLSVSEHAQLEEMGRGFMQLLTFPQLVHMLWAKQPHKFVVDMFQVCQFAAQRHRRNVVFRPVVG